MAGLRVAIVRTGTANTASVRAALERADAAVDWAESPDAVTDAPLLVLPGVGTFAAAAAGLEALGLVDPLRQRIRDGRPLLAICLGLQLMAEGSDESPGVPGLGAVQGRVTRFADGVRIPQFGWNRVSPDRGCRLLEPGYAYFANSYKLDRAPQGWVAALTDHGGPFVAAMEKGAVLACQFHPELSGAWGLALIRRWLDAAAASRGGKPC